MYKHQAFNNETSFVPGGIPELRGSDSRSLQITAYPVLIVQPNNVFKFLKFNPVWIFAS
jgi:hypothetical protein